MNPENEGTVAILNLARTTQGMRFKVLLTYMIVLFTIVSITQAYQLNATNVSKDNYAPVSIINVVVNSSLGTNTTSENLTVYTNESGGIGTVRNITDWELNGTSIAILNMPFIFGSNSTFTKDYSKNSNNGTVINAIWNPTGGPLGEGSYSFDGATSYIEISHLNVSNSITVTAWVNYTDPNQNGFIIGKNPVNTEWELFFETGVLKWRSSLGDDIDCASPSPNAWHYIVAEQSGSRANIYVDGVLCSTGTISTIGNDDNSVDIGRFDSGYYFSGEIAGIQVYDRSLSPAQIANIYNNQTDIIANQELLAGDMWSACITSNDGVTESSTVCSNNVTILAPLVPEYNETISNCTQLQNMQYNLSGKYSLSNNID